MRKRVTCATIFRASEWSSENGNEYKTFGWGGGLLINEQNKKHIKNTEGWASKSGDVSEIHAG